MLCRHEDLKIMLDSNKDGQKLDAMKMIMGVSPELLIVQFHINWLLLDGGKGQGLLRSLPCGSKECSHKKYGGKFTCMCMQMGG